MTFPKLHLLVPCIQAVNAGFTYLIGILCDILRLTAASDTSARTGHDLNEMILLLPILDPFQQLSGIGGAINHGNIDIKILNRNCSLPNSFIATYRL